jgi:hypothetical protein
VKSLAVWLATRSQEQLATLITQRSVSSVGHDARTLDELAERLLSPSSINTGLLALTSAGHQVLVAAARLATEVPDAPKAPVARSWGSQSPVAPNGGTVATELLLAGLGEANRPGPVREAAWEVLQELQRLALLWPHGEGMLGVPGSLMAYFTERQVGEARPLDRSLTASFNKEPVGIIAESLRVAKATGSRDLLQAEIVAYLTDGDKVRELIESAPQEARQLLDRILESGGLIETGVFPKESRHLHAKYIIATSYPDSGSLWLARRGLILPAGPDIAEVPGEVTQALRNGARFPFAFAPPTLPHVKVGAARIRGEAQMAAAGAVAKVSALLEALDQQPVAPRKTGGFPVRETRRLAKVMHLNETETRFWIGLANHAGLIGFLREGDGYLVCPTNESDRWLDRTTPERLALILLTWLGLGDVITWWPFTEEAPIAFGNACDPDAPELRVAVLSALATLPPDDGCLHATAAIGTNQPISAEVAEQLAALTRTATWFAPVHLGGAAQPTQQVLHTLYEAELLGVASHGALTDVGRSLLGGAELRGRATPEAPPLLTTLTGLLPAAQETARFQADMTVVVTGTPTTALATLLASVADRESEGHAVVYRISAATVRRALDAGAEAADLLAQLAEVAEGPLPQPVQYLVKEVGRAHGKMRVVRSACCIRCDDDSLIAELAKTRSLTKLGLRRIAPTVLISVKSPTETLAALRSAGYSPALEAETGVTVIERARGKRSPGPPTQPAAAAIPTTALRLAQQLLQRASIKPPEGK